MKVILLFTLTSILISCATAPVSKQDQLLTSIHWTVEPRSISNSGQTSSDEKEVYQFFNDGSYVLFAHDTRINGKWSWTNSNEMYIEEHEIIINGKAYNYDSSNNRYLRVVEISDKVFRTIERHEGDSWDSGFVKKVNYIPEG